MQKARQRWFKDRALFYAAFPIRDQAPQGAIDRKVWNFELKAVYLIAILDFEYDQNEERRKLQRNITLKDQDGDLFYDKLELIFLQMPLFTKTESELVTRSDKWMYFLQNLESFESIPAIFREPIFEQALATAEIAAMNKDELFQYEMSQMVQWDNYSIVETAHFEGQAKGRAEEKNTIACEMKKDGIDPKIIVKYTGLSLEEIKRLE
jgi:predicted transposase/invertase (TIGR01784 family)